MVTLHDLVGKIANSYLPVVVESKSFFVNDIPGSLLVENNEEGVERVVKGMLDAIVRHTRNTCIRLTAKKYGYVNVLEVQESGCISTYAVACGLQETQVLAQKIGGTLNISVEKKQSTIISFSFPDLPAIAA